MVNAVNPPDVWPPFGAFSMAVIQGDGHVVHLKGQVSLDRRGQVVGQNDIRAQARKVLENDPSRVLRLLLPSRRWQSREGVLDRAQRT
jgi:enamine deaminase RidA (YjgF/YER057c/UK114 family)